MPTSRPIGKLESSLRQTLDRLTRQRSRSHEVEVEFSPSAPDEVMPVLAQVHGTIARLLRRLRRDDGRETPAAPLLLQPGRVLQRWQRRQRRLEASCASWFSVFPGSVRPVSTTWPWTIKPALAVLWGVCWQYYPPSSGSFDARPRVPAALLESHLRDAGCWGWQSPDAGACELVVPRFCVPEASGAAGGASAANRAGPARAVLANRRGAVPACSSADEIPWQICNSVARRLRLSWRRRARGCRPRESLAQAERKRRPWISGIRVRAPPLSHKVVDAILAPKAPTPTLVSHPAA